jgi:hypothetical protein
LLDDFDNSHRGALMKSSIQRFFKDFSRFLLVLTGALLLAPGLAQAAGELTATPAAGTGWSGDVLRIQSSGTYTISMTTAGATTLTDSIVVDSGVTANITLNGVKIDVSSLPAVDRHLALDVAGATVNLTLTGVNVLTSGNNAGIRVPDGATLTITAASTGSLQATGGAAAGGSGYPGIGPGIATGSVTRDDDGGDIVINGGTVNAYGNGGGAGISTSTFYAYHTVGRGTVTINGGTVKAFGSGGGAGIGGNYDAPSGPIAITGGDVTAYGGDWGAGIGGGGRNPAEKITISGGTVYADARSASPKSGAAAGIGGGSFGESGDITILGTANVTAWGDCSDAYYGTGCGAGIGSGGDFGTATGHKAGIIMIDTRGGATVFANTSPRAATDSGGPSAFYGEGGSTSGGSSVTGQGINTVVSGDATPVAGNVSFSCTVGWQVSAAGQSYAWYVSTDSGATWSLSATTTSTFGPVAAVANNRYICAATAQNGSMTASGKVTVMSQPVKALMPGVPVITTPSLPDGTVGASYSQTLAATNPPITGWTVTSGTLPTGLTLDAASGKLSGTPTAAGTYTFSIKATNAAGDSDAVEYTVKIGAGGTAPVMIGTLPSGVVGTAYPSTAVTSTAGATCSLTSGALPPGLALASAGTITGTPTTAGSYSFAITCSNAVDDITQSYTMTIAPRNGKTTMSAPALNPWALALLAAALGLLAMGMTRRKA